jgi:hypothetical protein
MISVIESMYPSFIIFYPGSSSIQYVIGLFFSRTANFAINLNSCYLKALNGLTGFLTETFSKWMKKMVKFKFKTTENLNEDGKIFEKVGKL